jgi:signal transduction histidine kinase
VTDNGEGFDPSAETSETHRGMRNMMARAKAVDGTVRIESEPRQGTMVELNVPIER